MNTELFPLTESDLIVWKLKYADCKCYNKIVTAALSDAMGMAVSDRAVADQVGKWLVLLDRQNKQIIGIKKLDSFKFTISVSGVPIGVCHKSDFSTIFERDFDPEMDMR